MRDAPWVWHGSGFAAARHVALPGGSQDSSMPSVRVIPADLSHRYRPLFRFLGVSACSFTLTGPCLEIPACTPRSLLYAWYAWHQDCTIEWHLGGCSMLQPAMGSHVALQSELEPCVNVKSFCTFVIKISCILWKVVRSMHAPISGDFKNAITMCLAIDKKAMTSITYLATVGRVCNINCQSTNLLSGDIRMRMHARVACALVICLPAL